MNVFSFPDPSSGNSVDWAFNVANITFAYGVELRDTGQNGKIFFIRIYTVFSNF